VLFAVPALASSVIEDSQNRFIMDDEVLNSVAEKCPNQEGGYFLPENSLFDDGNGVPFRVYRIALPSGDKPSVSVSDKKLQSLGMPWCDSPDSSFKRTLTFKPVQVSDPVLNDGLWISEILVPLYVKRGSSISLRKEFRLQVDFAGKSSAGVNPGARAVGRVTNKVGASRFGVNRSNALKQLRKEAASQISDVKFLAQFFVGDKNLGSFSEDGLYAVDFKSIRIALMAMQLQDSISAGIPVDRLCLYGASPDTLSSVVPGAAGRNPNQLFEIPIEVRDHSPDGLDADGIFGEGDSIVFVGYGSGFWKRCDREPVIDFTNGKMDYFHSYSPYSFYQGFLLGRKFVGRGLRFSDSVKSASGSASNVKWMRYVRAEKDAILRDTYFGRSLDWESSTGKEWFWRWHHRKDSTHVDASELNTDETSELPGLVEGGAQYAAVSYFPFRSLHTGKVESGYDDQHGTIYVSGRSYYERMDSIRFAFDVNGVRTHRKEATLIPGGNFRIDDVKLRSSGNNYSLDMLPNDAQYDRFDGYSVAYQWNPVVDSAEWLLPGAVSGVINVPVPAGTRVMKFVNLRPVGFLNASSGVAKDSVSAADDVRYMAVRNNVYRTGLKIEGVNGPHDNVLNDLTRPNSKMEYLIVATTDFLDGAIELAEFRSNGSAVSSFATTVVDANDIYRSYTAGRLSPVAIRNYIAYVSSVCPNLKYVLLVGSGNYDYRGFNSRLTPNILPPFELEHGVYEDFFGILDSGEVVASNGYTLDLAVGRIPAQTPSEFLAYVRKAKEYEKLGVMDYSDWRSSLLLTADDNMNAGSADGINHTSYQESVARMIDSLSRRKLERWKMKKVYLMDYAKDASGQKKGAAEDFINILNQGALFTIYFGHGSKTDWAEEGLMKPGYITKLNNKGRYTIVGSFSCTVGRFDEGTASSLSEAMVLADGAGSIASIGATRESFAEPNAVFGSTLLRSALAEGTGILGDALLDAKRNVRASGATSITLEKSWSQRVNAERYVLLGEPVIRVPQPKFNVSLDKPLEKILALDNMTLSGRVEGMDNGFIYLSMNEGRVSKKIDVTASSSVDVSYDGALIYSEEVPVKNGTFKTQFVTPKKIPIGDSTAEFTAWAYSSNERYIAKKWLGGLTIEGFSSYADSLNDTIPPSVKIQSCYASGINTPFADMQTVKLQAPACLQVEIEDSTGLDFRESPDEGITFEVLGKRDQFHPWPYLEQTSKMAKIRMNFESAIYPPGKYEFQVRALDVVGNRTVRYLNVEITDDLEAGLADVFNAPNPMGKKGTTFYFKNLAVDRTSRVNIFIYNQNGKLVKVLKDAVSGVTRWNGRDEHGRLLANGLYHYVVRSEVSANGQFGKKTWTKKQKLLISR